MSVEFPDPQEQMIEQEYVLKCKVIAKDISYEDFQSKGVLGNVTEKMVFLIPKESTQRDLFFTAWLPDLKLDHITKELVADHSEVSCKAGHPIYGFFKCSVHRADERMREPYLFVMTRATEEDLKALDGKEILITVLPDSQSNLSDSSKDYELVENKNI